MLGRITLNSALSGTRKASSLSSEFFTAISIHESKLESCVGKSHYLFTSDYDSAVLRASGHRYGGYVLRIEGELLETIKDGFHGEYVKKIAFHKVETVKFVEHDPKAPKNFSCWAPVSYD